MTIGRDDLGFRLGFLSQILFLKGGKTGDTNTYRQY